MSELDRTDRNILKMLQEDGRITTVELADKVGLSPTAASERIKRLQREHYVLGYRAMLDPKKLGLGLLVFIEVTLDKTTPDVFERFADAVKRSPEVLECHHVAGDSDLLLKVLVKDNVGLENLLVNKIKAISAITRTRTTIILSSYKEEINPQTI